jgi:hypothetical protein
MRKHHFGRTRPPERTKYNQITQSQKEKIRIVTLREYIRIFQTYEFNPKFSMILKEFEKYEDFSTLDSLFLHKEQQNSKIYQYLKRQFQQVSTSETELNLSLCMNLFLHRSSIRDSPEYYTFYHGTTLNQYTNISGRGGFSSPIWLTVDPMYALTYGVIIPIQRLIPFQQSSLSLYDLNTVPVIIEFKIRREDAQNIIYNYGQEIDGTPPLFYHTSEGRSININIDTNSREISYAGFIIENVYLISLSEEDIEQILHQKYRYIGKLLQQQKKKSQQS